MSFGPGSTAGLKPAASQIKKAVREAIGTCFFWMRCALVASAMLLPGDQLLEYKDYGEGNPNYEIQPLH